MVIAGVLLTKYALWARNATGAQDWLENITGLGTTTGMYKVFGVIIVFLGFMIATGLGNNLLGFVLGPFVHMFSGLSGGASPTPTP